MHDFTLDGWMDGWMDESISELLYVSERVTQIKTEDTEYNCPLLQTRLYKLAGKAARRRSHPDFWSEASHSSHGHIWAWNGKSLNASDTEVVRCKNRRKNVKSHLSICAFLQADGEIP